MAMEELRQKKDTDMREDRVGEVKREPTILDACDIRC